MYRLSWRKESGLKDNLHLNHLVMIPNRKWTRESTIRKQCPNQHVKIDKKIDIFLSLLDKLLSIRTFSVNRMSLWTIFYQIYVVYHVLIRTCFRQFDHCFLERPAVDRSTVSNINDQPSTTTCWTKFPGMAWYINSYAHVQRNGTAWVQQTWSLHGTFHSQGSRLLVRPMLSRRTIVAKSSYLGVLQLNHLPPQPQRFCFSYNNTHCRLCPSSRAGGREGWWVGREGGVGRGSWVKLSSCKWRNRVLNAI